jgi:hypothetical protein
VPFFDDMNAIIFLAPISAFDQVLTEDLSVNRLVSVSLVLLVLVPSFAESSPRFPARLDPAMEVRPLESAPQPHGIRAIPQQVRHPES